MLFNTLEPQFSHWQSADNSATRVGFTTVLWGLIEMKWGRVSADGLSCDSHRLSRHGQAWVDQSCVPPRIFSDASLPSMSSLESLLLLIQHQPVYQVPKHQACNKCSCHENGLAQLGARSCVCVQGPTVKKDELGQGELDWPQGSPTTPLLVGLKVLSWDQHIKSASLPCHTIFLITFSWQDWFKLLQNM